jgi:hypothetical protein
MIESIINPIIRPRSSYSETQIFEQISTPYKEAARAEQEGEKKK